ncbi:MFS general substrate transporter [Peniophora sp. CONT]|nr:MFS general substrate transporter [Peniophora sp. CONT]
MAIDDSNVYPGSAAKSSGVEIDNDKAIIKHFHVSQPSVEQLLVTENEVPNDSDSIPAAPPGGYRLYKRRWAGIAALFALDAVVSMGLGWFGPIATEVSEQFGWTATQLNWLGNIPNCAYIIVAFIIPICSRRLGMRYTVCIGTLLLLISTWLRYAGTSRSLSSGSSYSLVLVGQFVGGFGQPFFQVISPKFSELWFDVKTRTTATMIIALANPIGGAIGHLIAPVYADTRQGILVLSIISSCACPLAILILDKPPTPPTFSGSKKSPGLRALLNALTGRKVQQDAYMTVRERIDFGILVWAFATFSAAIDGFSRQSSHWLKPYGYVSSQTGLIGSVLLLSGIAAALCTAPLLDRVLTHHIALAIRILCPIIGLAWLSLIWAVKENDFAGILAIFAMIGACSITLLPIAVELGVELTRNPAGSSAVLRFVGNSLSIVFIQVEGALVAPATASPPSNLHKGVIFSGVWCFASSFLVFFLEGRQARRERDVAIAREQQMASDDEMAVAA